MLATRFTAAAAAAAAINWCWLLACQGLTTDNFTGTRHSKGGGESITSFIIMIKKNSY
jgi:hypothetical protein